ncbi:mannose-1-phosphate guanylyltransferase/mannose-6-phosphate isomerase [Roseovarius confluentis]|uniref:mannose-1-phosphate guanylyltransferase/mannose-6-phosphate isomerase n=1 Tax=Roseovarius confluentis TaxID=1852027 RepID=UPI000CDD5895|nr:mannose-1-phosphate guanylyltransferase/mannose-6-phosphate isomerase [Roseovarius confluentis]
MPNVTPVILSGGSGTRLWPLSRKGHPKQFTSLIGQTSLFQQAATRLSGPGFEPPIVITHADFRFVVLDQLRDIEVDPGLVLIEPEGRNTAPAVLAATLAALAEDPDAVLLVAPSDHVIPDAPAFRDAVTRGLEAVEEGRLVTFGIEPDRAETGYGYLELNSVPDQDGRPEELKRFVEKPDADRAEQMLAAGNYLWNAGIFLFAAKDMKAAFEAYAPDLLAPVTAAVEQAESDLGFVRLAPDTWAQADDISIDYAVMEKADALSVVPYRAGWSDLGSWEAVAREMGQDEEGIAAEGPVTAIDCKDVMLRAEDPDQELVAVGVSDLLVVAMKDAVLVADPARAQDVKLAVSTLKEKGARQGELFAMDHRPWGHFETLAAGDRFQVKRIVVKPGAQLSLQSHHHRSEHWIVVAGTARVTIGDEVQLVTENQSVYIPLGMKHRMENPGKVPMILIEVQTGTYLGEDDIVRFDDIYARGQGAKG